MIANNSWSGFNPPSGGGFVFDLKDGVTDCSLKNLTIDGNDRGQPASNPPAPNSAGGINCSAREFVNRVSLCDIFGWSIWFGGQSSEEAQLVDCDADSPATGQRKGNDTTGGLGYRNKVIRFHWKPTLAKLDALDLANGGGGGECSVDIIDCINESAIDILLEGCTQSSVVGCRFYNNGLRITSDAKYTIHNFITNPRDIVVERCLFVGAGTGDAGPEPALEVKFDGGDYQTGTPHPTVAGGWISVIANRFLAPLISTIRWSGDDASTSGGGSLIADNRITDPNASGQDAAAEIMGVYGNQGYAFAAGIAIMSSFGLSITDNSINDGVGLMPYSMQLMRKDAAPPGQVQRILVKGNLCGNAPGAENGNIATFYVSTYGSATNPLPILFENTNQPWGYDSSPAAVVSNGVAWPPASAGGYQFGALVTVTVATSTPTIEIDGQPTGLSSGAFYVSVGQQITVSWSPILPSPTISVFRLA